MGAAPASPSLLSPSAAGAAFEKAELWHLPMPPIQDRKERINLRADRRTRAALLVVLLVAVLFLFFGEVLSPVLLVPEIRHQP